MQIKSNVFLFAILLERIFFVFSVLDPHGLTRVCGLKLDFISTYKISFVIV